MEGWSYTLFTLVFISAVCDAGASGSGRVGLDAGSLRRQFLGAKAKIEVRTGEGSEPRGERRSKDDPEMWLDGRAMVMVVGDRIQGQGAGRRRTRKGNVESRTGKEMALQEVPKKSLDMSPLAVDDQFLSCRDRMLQSLMGSGGLLERELKNSDGFRAAWQTKSCDGLIQGGEPEHSKALETYVLGSEFRYKFNNAVELQGSNANVYRSSFPYKSLHFLLTDAIHLLKEKNCTTLFRGSDTLYSTTKGSQVRFGRFTSAVESKSYAEEDIATRGTLFSITSCAAAHIESYICEHQSISWLIPPYEVFEVVDVKERDEYREITLTHKKLSSNHDCSFFTDAPSSFAPPMPPGSLPMLVGAVSLALGIRLQLFSG